MIREYVKKKEEKEQQQEKMGRLEEGRGGEVVIITRETLRSRSLGRGGPWG